MREMIELGAVLRILDQASEFRGLLSVRACYVHDKASARALDHGCEHVLSLLHPLLPFVVLGNVQAFFIPQRLAEQGLAGGRLGPFAIWL